MIWYVAHEQQRKQHNNNKQKGRKKKQDEDSKESYSKPYNPWYGVRKFLLSVQDAHTTHTHIKLTLHILCKTFILKMKKTHTTQYIAVTLKNHSEFLNIHYPY